VGLADVGPTWPASGSVPAHVLEPTTPWSARCLALGAAWARVGLQPLPPGAPGAARRGAARRPRSSLSPSSSSSLSPSSVPFQVRATGECQPLPCASVMVWADVAARQGAAALNAADADQLLGEALAEALAKLKRDVGLLSRDEWAAFRADHCVAPRVAGLVLAVVFRNGGDPDTRARAARALGLAGADGAPGSPPRADAARALDAATKRVRVLLRR